MRSLTHSDRNAVFLLGRLGNQLFQYSFARWLEAQTGLPAYFDLSMTRRVGIAGTERVRERGQPHGRFAGRADSLGRRVVSGLWVFTCDERWGLSGLWST